MEKYIAKVILITQATHDVLRIVIEKPSAYTFIPGQATEVAINKKGWEEMKRPFTFTSLPDDNHLEMIIKTYSSHAGVTNEFLKLKPGDELLIHDVWGAISYEGEGVFIAGGAGITPFLSILRHLKRQNKIDGNQLIFANKTKADIIQEGELKNLLGDAFINILSEEIVPEYAHGLITERFLKERLPAAVKKFYICGPPAMIDSVQQSLSNLGVGADSVVVEL